MIAHLPGRKSRNRITSRTMAEKIEPYAFQTHPSEMGHTIAIGPISSGKSVPTELAKLWATGNPGECNTITRADDNEAGR
ncbi:hypothetical protein AAB990_40090 [Burkholderia contaminans]|uniref:hypothetical protein n=1 Tax=Burkholderia contaminans TaxID=488447 RepID=UPI00241632D4|nr:hypothetical protein [Burkholderia contaminans]WFN15759.1 hypothetical protein LXE92_40650 [Burkholderia contaminans]